jgi:O-antigen ligase
MALLAVFGVGYGALCALSQDAPATATPAVWLLLAIGGPLLLVAALKRFDLYLGFYVLVVPLTRQVPLHTYISNGLTLLLIAAYLIRKALSGEIKILVPPRGMALAVIAYLGVLVLSTVLSAHSRAGWIRIAREIAFFATLVVISDSVRSRKTWWVLVLSAAGISLLTGLSVVAQAMAQPGLVGERLTGIFDSSTAAGLAVSVTFPVLLSIMIGRWSNRQPGQRSLLLIAPGLCLLAALLTISRSTLFVIVLSLMLAARGPLLRHPRVWVGLGLGLVGLVGLTLLLGLDQRIVEYLRIERGLSGREFLWQRAWLISTQHPLLGTGPGTFRYHVLEPEVVASFGSVSRILALHAAGELSPSAYYTRGLFGGVIGNSAHNIILGTLAETGWIGLMSVFVIFWVAWKTAHAMARRVLVSGMAEVYWVLDGCAIAIVAQFLRMQFEEPGVFGGSVAVGLPFWTMIVIVTRAVLFLQTPAPPPDGAAGPVKP